MRITSTQNPAVKFVRSLERTKERREAGVYLAEGVRLVEDALQTGQHATLVLYDEESLSRTARGSLLLQALPAWADRALSVDEHVLRAATQTENPAGVLAVLRLPDYPTLQPGPGHMFGLLLDHLADPGNAGTILRTAAAAGVDFVLTLTGTVDLFAPKVVRAGMGAHFRLPIYQHVEIDAALAALRGPALVAAEANGEHSIFTFVWPERTVLVVGSEASGLSPDVAKRVTSRVAIPMTGGMESLNAAVAASIILYLALGPLVSS